MWSSPIPQLGLGTYGRTGDAGMAAARRESLGRSDMEVSGVSGES